MKASDYIVEYFIKKGVTDVFGYPGGMVTHLIESMRKYQDRITAHNCYNEQGAAFEACGYAQVKGIPGVAYATSGPGATNLITGICNAWFDSIPVIFLTGQVNRNESCIGMNIRQRGFQEADIVSMVQNVTKMAVRVAEPNELPELLEHVWDVSVSGRKGPVLLDIPMDVLRADIFISKVELHKEAKTENRRLRNFDKLIKLVTETRRPCIIAGAALKNEKSRKLFLKLVNLIHVPVVTSMVSMDLLPHNHECNFGFIGAYGKRTANFIVAKADLVITLGSRLDIRQVGAIRENFAPEARLVRVDIDDAELGYSIRDDEVDVCANVDDVLEALIEKVSCNFSEWRGWLNICHKIAESLSGIDDQDTNRFVTNISRYIPDNVVITTDVGQNQVWVAQSFQNTEHQRILFSGGMGAMGYSLPAAIGACIASKRLVVSFNGDGGIQMNIQELQFVVREHLPVKIIIFNNHALGMIRHFQEMYFDSNYALTTENSGYTMPNFEKIAGAYGLEYYSFENPEAVNDSFMKNDDPAIVEVKINHYTYVKPKLRFRQPNQDQEPLIDRNLYSYLMSL